MFKRRSIFFILLIILNALILHHTALGKEFLHPGVLNTESDLQRIAQKVKNGEEPYLSGYNALCSNSFAQIGANRAVKTVVRGGEGQNFGVLYQDAHRAYLNAIRWKISGDKAHGDCARDILNAWSGTLEEVTGNADRYLASGIYGYEMVAAAELMRDYEDFELERMQDMLLNVFYKPLTERFLYSNEYGGDHNGAHIMNYWANWDLCNMAFATALGVFCDRPDIYERAVEYFKSGTGNGSIFNAVPKLYEKDKSVFNVPTGQWQESGRDFGHTELGVGLMAVMCEIAWNQGDDLYGWANNRFMHGAEYVAEYELGYEVPFTTYNWYSGTNGNWSEHSVISGRGGLRNIWEMIYNHYANRMGYDVPGIKKAAESVRPEHGAGGHASTFDQFGFGTLLYTRDKNTSVKAVLPKGNIKEGVYILKNRNSGKVMGVDENGYVKQYAINMTDESQRWQIKALGGGIYTLTNLQTGKTLGIENDSYENRARLVTGEYKEKFSQQFAFLNFDDEWDYRYNDYYRIVPVGSGLSVDVFQSGSSDGTDIIQYTYNTAANQQWEVIKIEPIKVNVPSSKEKQILYIATYSKSGSLERVQSEVFEASDKDTEYQVLIECDASKGEYVKSFLWNGNLKPVN